MRAFVKALDLSSWRQMSPDVATAVHVMSEAYLFERQVVEECAGRRMSNVIKGIASGQVEVGSGPFATVSYLIFELADGDVRAAVDAVTELDVVWALRVLHNVANGLRQLHGAGISHQDLKPSNVLTFATAAKIGDVGRSFWHGHPSPHGGQPVPGDVGYAPPECLYGFHTSDQLLRSLAIDAYHMGSMIRFMFTKVGATAALWANLDPAFYPGRWAGTFEDILPHLREAFSSALNDLQDCVPAHLRDDLHLCVRQLCDPDPASRGVSQLSPTSPRRYSMEFFVSRLDLLSKKAAIRARRALL
jgi:serine/threonine protein kinase